MDLAATSNRVDLGVDGQARKIIEEAQAGIFIRPENVGDLTEAVVRLASDPELRDTLGGSGRQHILQHFSRGQTARAYIQVLESLLEKENIPASIAA